MHALPARSWGSEISPLAARDTSSIEQTGSGILYRIDFPLQHLESFHPGSAVFLSVLLQPSFFLPAPTEEGPLLSTLLPWDGRSSLFQFSEDRLFAVRDDHVFLAIYDANIAILSLMLQIS